MSAARVLAISPADGQITKANGATVTGQVVQEGRHKKILVFHLKRKKQYKKMRGHRQDFTAVRITEIAFEGQKFSAPVLEKKTPKKKKVEAAPAAEAPGKSKAKAKTIDSAEARLCGAEIFPRSGNDFRLRTGFVVQGLGEFLQARDDLRRFCQHSAREFFRVIRAALRHLGKRHHHGEGVIDGVFDLAEFLLQFDEFFLGNCAVGVTHD